MKKNKNKNKNKAIEKLKKLINGLNPREKKLLIVVLVLIAMFALASIKPLITGAIEKFEEQKEELKKAEQDRSSAQTLINQYISLKKSRQEIEKNFEKNSFKEGNLQYCKSLSTSDMARFSIGQEQKRSFGKDFTRTTFKINFQAPSLSTVIGYIKKLENEKRKYLMSELSIKKGFNKLDVIIEVNSIEKINNNEEKK